MARIKPKTKQSPSPKETLSSPKKTLTHEKAGVDLEPSSSAKKDLFDSLPFLNVIAFIFTTCLPILIYLLWYALIVFDNDTCTQQPCYNGKMLDFDSWKIVFSDLETTKANLIKHFYPTQFAWIFYLGWYCVQILFYCFAPADIVDGLPCVDRKGTLKYPMNGKLAFHFDLITIAVTSYMGWFDLTLLAKNIGGLLTVSMIVVIIESIWLYRKALNGTDPIHPTGYFWRDFWLGLEIHPRTTIFGKSFDWKFFSEGRVGLALWVVMDWSFAAVQYEKYGYVSLPMLIVCAISTFYIWNYFWGEITILGTFEIIHERFGYQLVFGDLAWVPFAYCYHAVYLVDHYHQYDWRLLAAGVILHHVGFVIFRVAFSEKHCFRFVKTKPTDSWIETKAGTRLLTSGWWGWSRKPNYFGDYLICFSQSLVLGWESFYPYLYPWFYPIYFFILLFHRAYRDDKRCRQKYGKDWDKYLEKVPYRFVPGIY